MKKTLSAISALAVMIGLSISCQKELTGGQEPAGNKPFTITASIADSGTKVSYAEDGTSHALTPSWVVGDVIIGFDGDGNTYGYSVTEVNTETKKATLAIITEGDNAGGKTENPANDTKMYMFYAPGKKPTDIGTKSLTVSLASQDKDVVPALMMASATVTDNSLSLDFQNKTAIIGIKTPTMTTASKQYTSVVLSGTGINTEVVFSLSGETLQALYQTAGTITKTLDFTSDASTKQGPDVIYIVACPLTTDADLTFTFNGNEEYFKVAGATMEPGNYYYMTPTTGKQKFSITVDGSIANGSISTDKTEGTCAWGETVTVTATPAAGYGLDAITVKDADGVSVTVSADGKFTMPAKNVTVTATFEALTGTINSHNYVKIGGKKWATMNIGASSETDAGTYFAWGDVTGQTMSGSAWSGGGFSSAPDIGNPATLPSEYDAAKANWGSSWRMPTEDDFVALAANGVWYWTANYNSTGVKGYIVYVAKNDDDKGKANMNGTWKKWNGSSSYTDASAATETYDVTDPHIFFPAAGYGRNGNLSSPGTYGRYWSSTLYSVDTDYAYCLDFGNSYVNLQERRTRNNGYVVRPLSD